MNSPLRLLEVSIVIIAQTILSNGPIVFDFDYYMHGNWLVSENSGNI
jgi:hypothetical protein